MRAIRKHKLAAGLAVLAAACVAGAYFTGSAAPKVPGVKQMPSPVDERLMQTASQMAAMADTSAEQAPAHEALRLADHELDQAFASALREATAVTEPATGPFKALVAQIAQLKSQMTRDEARIAKLTKEEATGQMELAKAQLALDQDELEDAQEDLARQGGDQHSKLQRLVQEHEAGQHAAVPQTKIVTTENITTFAAQIGRWLALRDRSRQVDTAYREAASRQSALEREHNALEKVLRKEPPSAVESAAERADEVETAALVERLRHLSNQVKTLAELDKRSQDTQQLAGVYQRWAAVVDANRRVVLHAMLLSLSVILAILIAVMLIDSLVRRSFARQTDRKRLHHLRVVATIAIQLIGALLILLIVFGVPTQTSTMIGLATAGLTVVLKDFIVAFFGWFTLMGPNGIRVGDWVEIEGVSGEVIEVGVLKTVLLETTGGASTGHPTGRRVSFVNKFAIEGHYFNFSTAGQWLWDELRVTLPVTGNAYQLAMQIRERVERETDTDSGAAEQDWERVTRQYGSRPFSAKPAVDLRPSANGLDVIVRYVTHAPQRYEVKSRLFKAIVELVHTPAG